MWPTIKTSFIDKWKKYFSGSELPIACYYSDDPKAVIGLLDPSARACVKPNQLSFSIPWPKFLSMLDNMDDCFLNTYVWEKIHKRLKHSEK